jgi:hypothetical protein
MERSGAATPTELARKLQLAGYESPKRVRRWLDAKNEPEYEETLALLALAGLLNDEASPSAAADLVLARRAASRLADDLERLVGILGS